MSTAHTCLFCSTVALLCLSACALELPDDDTPPLDEHDPLEELQLPAAQSGAWQIPPETLAIGDTQYVSYTGAGPWRGESSCTGGMTPGASQLRSWIQTHWPQVSSIGGYSCRHINGDATQTSVHSTGRALDIFIPLDNGEADNELGDPLANWLIEHAEEIGVQFIIWDRWTWGAHRAAGSKSRSYGGAHPHHDHLHVEISTQAANLGTPFFQGAMGPPEGQQPCALLPASGGVLDDSSPCFRAYGPAQYWRVATGEGHGGSLRWTNAFASGAPSNWARWSAHLERGGDYLVEVNTGGAHGVWRTTRYTVRHDGREDTFTLDQSAANGWQVLDVLRFAEGGDQHISVYDNYTGTVPSNQHIAADAVRLTPYSPEPDPEPEPEPEPDPDPDPTPDPDPDPTPDPEPDPTPDPDPDPDPTPEPEPDPTPDPEPDPQPDPEPGPVEDPMDAKQPRDEGDAFEPPEDIPAAEGEPLPGNSALVGRSGLGCAAAPAGAPSAPALLALGVLGLLWGARRR